MIDLQDYKTSKALIEQYHIRANEGFAWASITVSEDGRFNAQSDYGNFSYHWHSPGMPIKDFLIRIMSRAGNESKGYLYSKLSQRHHEENIDCEETVLKFKSELLKARREKELDDLEARKLWEELDLLEGEGLLNQDAFISRFCDLPAQMNRVVEFTDLFETDLLEYGYDIHAEAFCKHIAPVFAELLRQEQEENKPLQGAAQ